MFFRSMTSLLVKNVAELFQEVISHWTIKVNTSSWSKVKKDRQLYWHADPHWQQQHMAVAACITSNRANMIFRNHLTLTFDLLVKHVYACQATATEYMCTKLGVDNASRFPFRVRTNRQTEVHERPTHEAAMPAWVNNTIYVDRQWSQDLVYLLYSKDTVRAHSVSRVI